MGMRDALREVFRWVGEHGADLLRDDGTTRRLGPGRFVVVSGDPSGSRVRVLLVAELDYEIDDSEEGTIDYADLD